MSSTIESAYTQEYDASLSIAGQQKTSRLLPTVELDVEASARKYFEKMDALGAPRKRTSRFAPVQPEDIKFSNRQLVPVPFEKTALIDDVDTMRTKIAPSSSIVSGQVSAFNRDVDDTIIAGLIGTAYEQATIDSAPTGVTLPGSQLIAIDYCEPSTGQTGNQPFTVGKIKEAKRIIFGTENAEDTEEVFCIVDQLAINQLVRDKQITSTLYAAVQPLVEGRLDSVRFYGMTFIRSERVKAQNAGAPGVLVYTKSAGKFGWLQQLTGRVDPRPDLQGNVMQMKANAAYAATRMWEERIVKIAYDATL